jgi:hypothetical protein
LKNLSAEEQNEFKKKAMQKFLDKANEVDEMITKT